MTPSSELTAEASHAEPNAGAALRILTAPLTVACVYLLGIVPRLFADGPLWFAHFGKAFLRAASTSSAISPSLGATSKVGYDGQFYFAMAADPAHAHDYIQPFATPGYVYSRALYPMLARVLGLGTVGGVAYALLLINLAAVAVSTLAVADWLRRRGVSPGYSLIYGLFPGLVFSTFRDLTEPLAYAFVALAVWAFDFRTSRGLIAAGGLMSCAVLTRETTAAFSLGFVIALIAADRGACSTARRLRRGVLFLVASAAPLLAWRFAVTLWLGSATQEHPGGISYLIPFHAYVAWWPWGSMQGLVFGSVAVPTILASGVLLASWREAGERLPLVFFFLNAIAFVAYLPAPVLVDYGAAGRAAMGVVLAFVYCIPVLRKRRAATRLLVVAWSPITYAVLAAGLGLPGVWLLFT